MEEEFIIFDTNYLNMILNNKNKYNDILIKLKSNYSFSINITTFVEIVQQKINNQCKFNELMNFLISNEICINEFKMNKCIKDKMFSFERFKIESKKCRKKYFYPIRDNYYNFLCKFISLFLEWILYALMMLLSENLNGDMEYKRYLNKQSIQFQKEFIKLYDGKMGKIKDKFNYIVYSELKKLNHNQINTNQTLMNEIIKSFNGDEKEMMKIFHAESKASREIRKKFIDYFFIGEIKPFLDSRFKNVIFEYYVKYIFEKLIEKGGKLDGNDIADALIVSNIDQSHVLLTNDKKIIKFLKKQNLYEESIYNMFRV